MAALDTAELPLAALPLAPKNPLPYWERRKAVRSHHTGVDTLRDAGGPVTLITLAPSWLIPPIVLATSPQGIATFAALEMDLSTRQAQQTPSFVGCWAAICSCFPTLSGCRVDARYNRCSRDDMSTNSAGTWPRRRRCYVPHGVRTLILIWMRSA